MTVIVREAKSTDRDTLIDLKLEMNRVEMATMPSSQQLRDDRDLSRAAAEAGVTAYLALVSGRGGEYLVAERDGRVVGCIVWYLDQGSNSIKESVRGRAQIAGFVVAAAARGAGIGKKLMLDVERRVRLRGIARMSLGVVAWNQAAIDFYRRDGFAPAEMIMSKALD